MARLDWKKEAHVIIGQVSGDGAYEIDLRVKENRETVRRVAERLKTLFATLESEKTLERAAALRPIIEQLKDEICCAYNTPDMHDGCRIRYRIVEELDALIPTADAWALDKRDAEMQHKGWVDCLRNVVASLEGYPNQGGDIDVMKALDKLVAEARLEEAAIWHKKDLIAGSAWGEERISNLSAAPRDSGKTDRAARGKKENKT